MSQKIRLEDRECPLSATLGLVGEWWTLLILHDAFDGYTRFDEFQANLGISSSLLTSRLKQLVANGLLERRQYQEHPPRYEYELTELGRSLRPVLVALAAWGNARLAPSARSMVLVDVDTGVEAEPVLVDRVSGRRVDGPEFVFSAGPAASKPFRDRYEDRPSPSPPARGAAESRTARILEQVRAIPRGSVRTYSDIDPKAPRVVGRVLATTREKVPWHRVVRADGTAPMGADQLVLLRKERVPMDGDRVDLARANARDPKIDPRRRSCVSARRRGSGHPGS
jgi:DNA-binding HxlR family transcriptional regulator/alkylated DNA nucleotide flippase Atl1